MTIPVDILALSPAFWAAGWWDIVLSAAIFATVVVGVLAVFSQPGQIQRSPQREAALAAGQADRATLFENPLVRPLLWLLLSVAHRLNLPRLKGYLNRQIVAAGSPNYYTSEEYLALAMLAGLGLAVVFEILQFLLTGELSLMAILLGLVTGVGLSVLQLSGQASKRLRSITRQLPYAMDLVSLAMGAGATFTEAVRTIVRDRPLEQLDEQQPLNDELKALLAEIELGTTRRDALQNLARRVPLQSMQSLVASITQAEQLGTPISNVLHDQATLLRLHRSTRAENKAAVASVRILIPCLLLVMAVILAVFGPAIIRTLQGGLFG